MDFRVQRTEHTAAVPLGGGIAVGVVLRGGTGSGREFALDAVDRRAIHTDAVLRNPEDGLVLGEQGYAVNAKRVRRLMRQMGLEAIYPKPRLSDPGLGHKIYPYLLRSLKIDRPDHVWSGDITYIRGAQFTSEVFTNRLEKQDITISMDGRGRAIDNIFIERLWRTVKYEEVYLKDYVDVLEAVSNLKSYFTFYNHERPHQSLGYQTPAAIYFGKVKCV
jgi:putative transposase